MYAVIETGGKQHRVEVGTELEVELLEAEPGQSVVLDRVLLVADGAVATVGTPVVAGASVEAEVVRRARGDKVVAFKYRPKARRRVIKGHRQELTILRIADIRFNGRSAAGERPAKKPATDERARLEAAAARQAAEDAAIAARLAQAAAPKPAAKPAAKPAEQKAAKPAAKAAAKPAEEKAAKPAAKPAEEKAAKPAAKPAEQKAAKPAATAAPRKRTAAQKDE